MVANSNVTARKLLQLCALMSSCFCSRAPELNPVENVWQYLRQNWLSNTVFENYDAIVDAACNAWRNLTADPERITSIGMRDWAHIGQSA